MTNYENIMTLNVNELNLLSYNIGLAHGYVPYAEARLPKLASELKKSDADILCLRLSIRCIQSRFR